VSWTNEDRRFLRRLMIADAEDYTVPAALELDRLQWHRLVSGRSAAQEESKAASERAETFAAKAARLEVSRNNWRVGAYAAAALAAVLLMALISATHRTPLCQ